MLGNVVKYIQPQNSFTVPYVIFVQPIYFASARYL